MSGELSDWWNNQVDAIADEALLRRVMEGLGELNTDLETQVMADLMGDDE